MSGKRESVDIEPDELCVFTLRNDLKQCEIYVDFGAHSAESFPFPSDPILGGEPSLPSPSDLNANDRSGPNPTLRSTGQGVSVQEKQGEAASRSSADLQGKGKTTAYEGKDAAIYVDESASSDDSEDSDRDYIPEANASDLDDFELIEIRNTQKYIKENRREQLRNIRL